MNIADAVLQERDRLMKIKDAAGDTWGIPEFFFVRAVWDNLIKRANEALGGHMEVTQMIALYTELKEFEA